MRDFILQIQCISQLWKSFSFLFYLSRMLVMCSQSYQQFLNCTDFFFGELAFCLIFSIFLFSFFSGLFLLFSKSSLLFLSFTFLQAYFTPFFQFLEVRTQMIDLIFYFLRFAFSVINSQYCFNCTLEILIYVFSF